MNTHKNQLVDLVEAEFDSDRRHNFRIDVDFKDGETSLENNSVQPFELPTTIDPAKLKKTSEDLNFVRLQREKKDALEINQEKNEFVNILLKMLSKGEVEFARELNKFETKASLKAEIDRVKDFRTELEVFLATKELTEAEKITFRKMEDGAISEESK